MCVLLYLFVFAVYYNIFSRCASYQLGEARSVPWHLQLRALQRHHPQTRARGGWAQPWKREWAAESDRTRLAHVKHSMSMSMPICRCVCVCVCVNSRVFTTNACSHARTLSFPQVLMHLIKLLLFALYDILGSQLQKSDEICLGVRRFALANSIGSVPCHQHCFLALPPHKLERHRWVRDHLPVGHA